MINLNRIYLFDSHIDLMTIRSIFYTFRSNQALEFQIFRFGRQIFVFFAPKSKDLGLKPYPEI